MRLILFILTFVLLGSCNLKETIGKVQVINDDLEKTFNHHEIFTSIGLGTEDEDNHVVITFCDYDLDNKTFKEMENFAVRVRERVLLKNPSFKNLDNIEVRLTKEKDTDDLKDFVVFKHKNED